jgi:hypothetical protein
MLTRRHLTQTAPILALPPLLAAQHKGTRVMRYLSILAFATLTACTTAQQQAAVNIAIGALPCYDAVAASITSGTNATKALTAADVLATSPACVAVDGNTLTLIASALNTGTPVQAAPTSSVAAVRAPKR